jgi:hypothetical protein
MNLQIECGEKTCASKPGKFCHLFNGSLGGRDTCFLFGGLYDDSGWIQRDPKCIEAFKEEKE